MSDTLRFVVAAWLLAAWLVSPAQARWECSGLRLSPELVAACLGGEVPASTVVRSWGTDRALRAERAERPAAPRRVELEVNFAFGRDELSNDTQISLRNIAQFLTAPANMAIRLQVVGHTDAVGSDEVNQLLSERRASRVSAWLVQNGVVPERLRAEGRGRRELKRPEEPAAAENRRVDFVVTADAR